MTLTRRDLLGLAGLGAAVAAGGVAWRYWPDPPLPLTDMADPAGFQRLSGGAVTAGGVPLFGLDQRSDAMIAADAQVASNLCGTLFGPTAAGTVPMAYFYDYQCPICRRLTPRLRDLSGVTMTWHDLAGLGPASETAARAAIAARAQGGFDVMHDRLMRAAFQPNEGYVRALSDSSGLDTDRLIADMSSPETTRALLMSQALSDRFGMPGTPGLVIGRVVVMGDVSTARLQQLVEKARTDPGNCRR